MKLTREPDVRVTLRVPESLHQRMVALAATRKIPLNELLTIWVESQLAPGADVVLGKSHG